MKKLLIKNAHIDDANTKDILIEDGLISKIDKSLQEDCEVINADGLYVLPGLIDAHCHLRDPGFEYKEDIESGTKSAAAGGFTSIACMPNTSPVTDNKTVVKYILGKAKMFGVVNVLPIATISKGSDGDELSEMGDLKEAGAVAVSDDGKPVTGPLLMKRALQYAQMFNLPVISHCEELEMVDGGSMNEGLTSTLMGLKGIPSVAEEIMVSRDLILAEFTRAAIHIAHVSTALSVDLIRNAKRRGVKVTCETCPHYFTLTEEACEGFNTLAKVNPPLRTKKDVEAIIEGLKDGTIDIIATDHAPHHIDDKNVEFAKAANGMIGFETAFPLAITYLVKPGHLSLLQLIEKMCLNPAKLLRLDRGEIAVGKVADLTIVDLDSKFTVDVSKFKSKSKNSPFDGFKLSGKIVHTIVNGNIIGEYVTIKT